MNYVKIIVRTSKMGREFPYILKAKFYSKLLKTEEILYSIRVGSDMLTPPKSIFLKPYHETTELREKGLYGKLPSVFPLKIGASYDSNTHKYLYS